MFGRTSLDRSAPDRWSRDPVNRILGHRAIRWNSDSVRRAHRFKAFGWGACPGVFIGTVLIFTHGLTTGLMVMIGVTVFVGVSSLTFAHLAGGAVRATVNPHGPRRRSDHSRVDALLAGGDARMALDVLEVALQEDPHDAEAMVRIARIHRDVLGDACAALMWFRRGRASGCFDDGRMKVTLRELLELTRKMGDPVSAAPDLARHRDRFAGSDEGEWAARELAGLRAGMER